MAPRLDHFRLRRLRKGTAALATSSSDTEPRRPTTAPSLSIPPANSNVPPPIPSGPHSGDHESIQQTTQPTQSLASSIAQQASCSTEKPSLFRQLKARATKRARSPAVPQLPLTAIVSQATAAEPHPLSRSGTPGPSHGIMESAQAQNPSDSVLKIPSFLESSDEEILSKFHEIVWRERTRLQSQILNPSPSNVWARYHPRSYPQYLDRYSNIHPWNNNRVRLRVPPGQVNYINASPIELHSPSTPGRVDRYIAMQGPTARSWPHVWRMVAEQLDSPAVIVMLTETHEVSGAEKCFGYFPRLPTSDPMTVEDEFGDGFKATVRCESIEMFADNAIELRKILVKIDGLGHLDGESRTVMSNMDQGVDEDSPHEQEGGVRFNSNRLSASSNSTDCTSDNGVSSGNSSSASSLRARPSPSPVPSINVNNPPREQVDPPKVGEDRIVYHFLYKQWPDFGVPDISDLDSFLALMRMSREYNREDNPRIVHCSAGVGRSGTFIALEHLMRELEVGYLESYDEYWTARLSAPPSNRSSYIDQDDAETCSSISYPGGGGAPIVPIDMDGSSVSPQPLPVTNNQSSNQASQTAAFDLVSKPPGRNGAPPDLIYETVDALRRQRKTMVQAESQFFFLYEVLNKLWRDKYARTDGEPAAKRLEVGSASCE